VLGTIIRASYAIKLGAKGKVTRPYRRDHRKASEVPFLKGHHICAFNLPTPDELTEEDEMIDLSKMDRVSGASMWKDVRFYEENQGAADETGLGQYEYAGRDLVNNNNPSDTLCCFVPEVYVTLGAAVGNPLEVCAMNTVSVVVPLKYSAHVIAALINSRISRYYAFLLLRSGILLRRRAHWYPRTLKNLPLPELSNAQAGRLHALAKEAESLSRGVHLSELDAYVDLISRCQNLTKAGFLGVRWSGEALMLDRDDLADASIDIDRLQVGNICVAGETSVLHLLRLALLSLNEDEVPLDEVQNVMLPGDPQERANISAEVLGVVSKLDQIKQRMNDISEEIDETVAAALGLTSREHERIRKRCEQFPLSVTVERPRYVWSTDRKRQARRIYEPGERFK